MTGTTAKRKRPAAKLFDPVEEFSGKPTGSLQSNDIRGRGQSVHARPSGIRGKSKR